MAKKQKKEFKDRSLANLDVKRTKSVRFYIFVWLGGMVALGVIAFLIDSVSKIVL